MSSEEKKQPSVVSQAQPTVVSQAQTRYVQATYLPQRPPTPQRTPPADVQQQQQNQVNNQVQPLKGMQPTDPPAQASTPSNSDFKVQTTMSQQSMNIGQLRASGQASYYRPTPPTNQNLMANQRQGQQAIYPQQSHQFVSMSIPHTPVYNNAPAVPYYNNTPRPATNFLSSSYQVIAGQNLSGQNLSYAAQPPTQPQPQYYYNAAMMPRPPQQVDVSSFKASFDTPSPRTERQYSESVENTRRILIHCNDKEQLINIALECMQTEIDRIKTNERKKYLEKVSEILNNQISETNRKQEGGFYNDIKLNEADNNTNNIMLNNNIELTAAETPEESQEILSSKPVVEAKSIVKKINVTDIVVEVAKPNIAVTTAPFNNIAATSAAKATEPKGDTDDVVINTENDLKAETADPTETPVIIETKPDLPYSTHQWTPWKKDGLKVYAREFLLAMSKYQASLKKPENLPGNILKMEQGRVSDISRFSMGNSMGKIGRRVCHLGINGKAGGPNNNKPPVRYTVSLKNDIKLNEADNAWKPARFAASGELSEDEEKTAELYKRFRGILNKLTPQKFDTLMTQVQDLNINTSERLQGIIDLVFEKAVDEPQFGSAYSSLCRELAMVQVPLNSGEGPEEFVNFRKLLTQKIKETSPKQNAQSTSSVVTPTPVTTQKPIQSSGNASVPVKQQQVDKVPSKLKSKAKFHFLNAPQPRISVDLLKRLSKMFADNTPVEEITMWISKNVSDDAVQEYQFIRTLATAIIDFSIVNEKLKSKVLAEKYCYFLRYVDNNPNLELQCLFALQSLINKLEHPQGLLLNICNKLYEDTVFSLESFLAWETNNDPLEQEGKGVMLKQLTAFFEDLKDNEYSSASEDA